MFASRSDRLVGRFVAVLQCTVLVVVAVSLWHLADYMQTPAALLVAQKPPAPVSQRHFEWLEIPALDIALSVKQGDGSDRIGYGAAFIYPGTVSPGAPGNSYLYAHGIPGMFGPLFAARVGDAVLVHDYTANQVQTFHVQRIIGFVRYDDVRWIEYKADKPVLTLQTCVDDNPKGERFIVQAW